mgnify:CR=1 FL=1
MRLYVEEELSCVAIAARLRTLGVVISDIGVRKHLKAAGVVYTTAMAKSGPGTGRCYILVTPDGERTMNTYLGAAQDLTPADIDEAQIAASAITYLEGYLWDPPQAKEAFLKASKIAHGAGRKVALTLSDAFCVDRYRGEFLDLMRSKTVDLIFANESELHSLYQTSDFDTALKQLSQDVALGVVDTINMQAGNEIDYGMPGGKNMHLTERIHFKDNDPSIMVIDEVIEAPQAFTRPYRFSVEYGRREDGRMIEFDCAQNNRDINGKGGQMFNTTPPPLR